MITASAIRGARERLRDGVLLSPCPYSTVLSKLLGCEVFLKLENLQATGAFKVRGSFNKIRQLSEQERASGVITASAGNHAQGVAYAARLGGITATVVMPETAPLAKIKGTRELGAQVVLHGSGYDEAYQHAMDLQQETKATFIHAFDDPDVIAGQGTIGLEILDQVPDLDAVVVPIGGGGLIAGIALALHTTRPGVRLIGVQAAQMPSMKRSLERGHIVSLRPSNTIADGIAVARVGNHTYPLVQRYVEDVVTVSEEEIASAILLLLEKEKTLAEGAGAVGFAALYRQRIAGVHRKRMVVVVSGGNIDMTALAKIVERGLEQDGRLTRLKVIVPDKAGSIAEIATIIARHGANILDISQNRSCTEVNLGQAEVELTLETRDYEHVQGIIRELRDADVTVK